MGPLTTSLLLSLLPTLSQSHPTTLATWNNLARDAATLSSFASTLTSDPQNLSSNWTGTEICSWEGITCAQHPNGYLAIAGIDFNEFHLGSNLHLQNLLDKLVDLAFFHANTNDFTGTVPDLSKLEYLYELDLSNNNLTGTFPTSVFSAPLTFLDLRFNSLTGPLPLNLFQNRDMDVLFLNDNKFSGTIPEAKNISTKYITLANNELEGEIPKSLRDIKGLKEILLLGNKLTGDVPEELCALDLDVLDVSGNGLNGELGPECRALKDKGVLKM